MADFSYTVKKGDQGLTYIFKEAAEKEGYNVDSSKINWNNVMSVFDKIQEEKKQANEPNLYEGGNDKTRAGWGSSYVIKIGQVIELTRNQLNRIFEAMGIKLDKTKESKPAEETAAAQEASKTVKSKNTEKVEDLSADNIHKFRAYTSAESIWNQIDGISLPSNTRKILKDNITAENAAYIVKEYKELRNGVSLAKDIWDEWGLAGYTDIHEYVCKPLKQQAEKLNITIDDYINIKELDKLEKWIDDTADKIREKENETVNGIYKNGYDTLAKMSKMDKSQYEIIEDKNEKSKAAILSSDVQITVYYDNQGEISDIIIWFSGNNKEDLFITKSYVSINTDFNNHHMEYRATGHDFEQWKKLAEEIFS